MRKRNYIGFEPAHQLDPNDVYGLAIIALANEDKVKELVEKMIRLQQYDNMEILPENN